MLIGLTGMYCAGKNFIGSLLEARGLAVLDVDKLGYLVLEDEKERIFTEFGGDLANKDGSLNRQLLGEKVFGNLKKLILLENIVHPPVNRMIDKWIAAQSGSCVINAALLHKSDVFSRLDRVVLVTAPYLTRFIRAKRRDKLSFQAVFKRLGSQKKFNSQYLLSNAEIYRVENPGLTSVPCLDKKLEDRLDKFLYSRF
jgi:dephospho-CoA kinase